MRMQIGDAQVEVELDEYSGKYYGLVISAPSSCFRPGRDSVEFYAESLDQAVLERELKLSLDALGPMQPEHAPRS